MNQETQNWIETAAQNQRNADYYRDLIERTGRALGIAARTTDAGEVVDGVLCAKVPEIVEELASRVRYIARDISEANSAIHHRPDGITPDTT